MPSMSETHRDGASQPTAPSRRAVAPRGCASLVAKEILIRRLHNPRELATRSAFLEHAAAGGVFWVALLVAMCWVLWRAPFLKDFKDGHGGMVFDMIFRRGTPNLAGPNLAG